MKYPKISIVTPSYNQAQYLEQTLRSVLEQQYPNLEYIVIDAGSTDGSVDIIKEYADRLTYWISEKDQGHADGINKGFAHTTGEIMGWLNSSDIYFPWTLETIAQVFTDVPEVKWISGMPSHFSEGTAPQNISLIYINKYDFLSGNYKWLQQESIFWKRSLWNSSGSGLDTNLKYACDFELWLRFFNDAELYSVNTILASFRFHEDRRSKTGKDYYRDEADKAFEKFYGSSDLKSRLLARVVRLMNNRRGRVIRKILSETRSWAWYDHPRIIFDFDAKRWRIWRNPSRMKDDR
jgi:glycosyltransferase involved in cell wall biosynthesis